MKYLLSSTFIFLSLIAFSQKDTVKVNSKVESVTVYFQGAHISRKANVKLNQGKQTIALQGITGQLDPDRIEIKPGVGLTLLSVNHRLRKADDEKKKAEIKKLEKEVKRLENRMKLVSNEEKVYGIEERLLMENMNFQSKESGATIAEIRQAADFYRARLNEIRRNKLSAVISMEQIADSIRDVNQKWGKLKTETDKIQSEIIVAVDVKPNFSGQLEFNYFVEAAGWTPLYDFRVSEITKPLEVKYNANVYQSTGEDWNKVSVTLTSGLPEMSGTVPKLEPWYINRPIVRPQASIVRGQGSISGQVIDKDTREPIPFANVVFKQNGELAYGTATDFHGNYVVKPIKEGYYDMEVIMIGYEFQPIRVYIRANQNKIQDIAMNESIMLESAIVADVMHKDAFNDVTVRGARQKAESYYIDGVKADGAKPEEIFMELTANQISYEIPETYTIPSNGLDYFMNIKEQSVPAHFKYRTLPKYDTDVYLIAFIPQWSQLDLLSGNSSIYYQGAYTGDAYVDADFTGDTLELSLGRDRNITVKREGNKEINDKRFIGDNIREMVGWDIKVRNNKSTPIEIEILDQFPLSEVKSIEVKNGNYSGAELDEKTGGLTWKKTMNPQSSEKISFDYQLKYPDRARIYR